MLWNQLFKFNKTNRAWHLPVVAGICIGIPILLGLYFDNLAAGKTASIGALVILYIQSDKLINRMMVLMVCGFGFIFSYTIGLIFSQSFWLSPLILALYTFGLHYALFRLTLNKPPGNFFFTMIASMAIAVPKDTVTIPASIGYLSIGVMVSCVTGLLYSLLTLKKENSIGEAVIIHQNKYVNITESIILGATVGASLLVAKLFKMENPYWIPISCMAVMQGITTTHVWARAIQRVLGTLIGLVLTWCLLQFKLSVLGVCVCIIVLQTIVEFLVVRNYALAAVFITMLTIFLAETNVSLTEQTGHLIKTRFLDTLIGSAIGAIGGWMLYHEQIHFYTKKQMKKTKVILNRMKPGKE
ncbi:FUSC family protein [Terrimonas sp.]|uniref:FUSC family protein n=1 Tax=Terrimonas sp. TaxID=1914338 RepID=UPI000D51E5F1|nr:FUSC family protein [Terrimonas sp.]PVD51673.1 FUSC family protein [Terrimonas sp.]